MGRPTIFYILENRDLGTWWVGKMAVTLNDGWPPYRPVTQDELYNKLQEKYEQFSNPYVILSPINKGWVSCYGVERWLSKLEYNINKEPEKYRELKELLMAGWNGNGEVSTLSVLHVFRENQPIDEIFKKLVKSREGLTKCLNTRQMRTYNDRKDDHEFLKKRMRIKVLYDIKKKQKPPKQSTIDKYDIKDHEIKKLITSVLVSPV